MVHSVPLCVPRSFGILVLCYLLGHVPAQGQLGKWRSLPNLSHNANHLHLLDCPLGLRWVGGVRGDFHLLKLLAHCSCRFCQVCSTLVWRSSQSKENPLNLEQLLKTARQGPTFPSSTNRNRLLTLGACRRCSEAVEGKLVHPALLCVIMAMGAQ